MPTTKPICRLLSNFVICLLATKNPAYGQHSALSYVWDSGVPILCHVSKSIPWVLSITWVHAYTMRLCQYHEALSIPWVHVYTMSSPLYHESRSSNKIPKIIYSTVKNYRFFCCCLNITILRNTEKQITGIQKHKLHIYQNTN